MATGSPAGVSASPVSATGKARPPAVGVSTVRGQGPFRESTMSAACFVCARSCLAETCSLTYGFFADAVRWQIVRVVASVPA